MAPEHEIDAAGGQRPAGPDEDGPGGGDRGDGRSYMGLAGDAFADFDRVVCGQCDYAYPVLDVQDPTPLPERCPNDDSALTYRSAGWQPGAE